VSVQATGSTEPPLLVLVFQDECALQCPTFLTVGMRAGDHQRDEPVCGAPLREKFKSSTVRRAKHMSWGTTSSSVLLYFIHECTTTVRYPDRLATFIFADDDDTVLRPIDSEISGGCAIPLASSPTNG